MRGAAACRAARACAAGGSGTRACVSFCAAMREAEYKREMIGESGRTAINVVFHVARQDLREVVLIIIGGAETIRGPSYPIQDAGRKVPRIAVVVAVVVVVRCTLFLGVGIGVVSRCRCCRTSLRRMGSNLGMLRLAARFARARSTDSAVVLVFFLVVVVRQSVVKRCTWRRNRRRARFRAASHRRGIAHATRGGDWTWSPMPRLVARRGRMQRRCGGGGGRTG